MIGQVAFDNIALGIGIGIGIGVCFGIAMSGTVSQPRGGARPGASDDS